MSITRLVISIALCLILLSSNALVSHCSRSLKSQGVDVESQLLLDKLPRGQVPPSGPSQCHYEVGPDDLTKLSHTQDDEDDDSMCP